MGTDDIEGQTTSFLRPPGVTISDTIPIGYFQMLFSFVDNKMDSLPSDSALKLGNASIRAARGVVGRRFGKWFVLPVESQTTYIEL